jgi:hypothetical protein
MKTNTICVIALCVAGLGAGAAFLSCSKEQPHAPEVSAADKAASQKAASDKAAADKAAADRLAADKAAAAKAAADKAAADTAAATAKAAADKTAAEKAAADKVAADKAAAEKAASQQKAEVAAQPPDMVEMKAEITRVMAQMDLTMAKLDILNASTGELDKPSEDALAAIAALETEAQALKKRGEQMRERGAAYFELWEKQLAAMTTPEIAEIATKRKDELAAQYAEVLTAMQETASANTAFWTDMNAIKKAIEEDLTPEKNQLLAPQVKAAKEKGATLKSRIESTIEKMGQVSLIYAKR